MTTQFDEQIHPGGAYSEPEKNKNLNTLSKSEYVFILLEGYNES